MLGIAAEAYYYIYLFLLLILTWITYARYANRSGLQPTSRSSTESGSWILVTFLVVFIGFRPMSGLFVDMVNYNASYYAFYFGYPFHFERNAENVLFDNLFAWWGAMNLSITSFFVCIAAIYFITAYWGIRRLFPNDRLAAYLVFLGAFSTFSYGTNGIKAGAAASLFIWAISYRENLKICIPLILLSWGFHHSMQLPVYAFVLTLLFKNPKWYFYGWIACVFLAFLHVSFFSRLFASISDESGAGYLMAKGGDDGTKGGFRIDFILYSFMPVLVGYWALFVKRVELSSLYKCLLNLYLCTNGVWMLCMYASFTNRIAYLSWFLYPVVLIYPFLNEAWGVNRYRQFSKVMALHLTFTLFMTIVYYR